MMKTTYINRFKYDKWSNKIEYDIERPHEIRMSGFLTINQMKRIKKEIDKVLEDGV